MSKTEKNDVPEHVNAINNIAVEKFKEYLRSRKDLDRQYGTDIVDQFDAYKAKQGNVKEKRLLRESTPEAKERLKAINKEYYQKNREKKLAYYHDYQKKKDSPQEEKSTEENKDKEFEDNTHNELFSNVFEFGFN